MNKTSTSNTCKSDISKTATNASNINNMNRNTIDEKNDLELNKKAMQILQKDGSKEVVKFMFNPTGTRQLSYSEMRARFG